MPNPGQMTDEDLYQFVMTTKRPSPGLYLNNLSAVQAFDNNQAEYARRGSPRVYSTDNSFAFPTTQPVHPNTALIPATGQPAPADVIGSASQPAAPQFGPEVTAQTGMPGAVRPDMDTVASQFRIPSQRLRRSATQVR